MRLLLFLKLLIISLCISLLSFALLSFPLLEAARLMALATVASVAITAFYPDFRGVKQGDPVAVVTAASMSSLFGRPGRAAMHGKKNQQIKINLDNGTEVLGVIESYPGLVSPTKIRLLYEERPVD